MQITTAKSIQTASPKSEEQLVISLQLKILLYFPWNLNQLPVNSTKINCIYSQIRSHAITNTMDS